MQTEVADVIVVGYGYAGGVAAITAADAGADTILLEKMPMPGGISVVSGGGMAAASDAQGAFAYLRRTNLNTAPDDVLWAMAQGMTELRRYLEFLQTHSGLEVHEEISRSDRNVYDFPGAQSIASAKIRIRPGKDFPGIEKVQGLRGGARLFRLVSDNVDARPRIRVVLDSAATELLMDGEGRVIGVKTGAAGGASSVPRRILARRGVVLATGGFEFDEDMKLQFFNLQPVYGVVGRGNTGDGIRLAQQAGAKLWHTWHFHGSYGFKFPEFPMAFRHWVSGPRVPDRLMQWILLDKHGHRFMNEYPPAVQDTGWRELAYYDVERAEYPRIPAYLVFDEVGRRHGPLAMPMFVGEEHAYQWSSDNTAEVARGWIRRASDVGELAGQLQVPAATLAATLDQWNRSVTEGVDPQFGRLPGTMLPVRTPPFYWLEVWPIASNTQGGPAHDAQQRILRADGTPVPRLYAAGELGSLFGHLYLEGGNVAECFVTGRIAGREAAAPPDLPLPARSE